MWIGILAGLVVALGLTSMMVVNRENVRVAGMQAEAANQRAAQRGANSGTNTKSNVPASTITGNHEDIVNTAQRDAEIEAVEASNEEMSESEENMNGNTIFSEGDQQ